jgi:hypothetical protein
MLSTVPASCVEIQQLISVWKIQWRQPDQSLILEVYASSDQDIEQCPDAMFWPSKTHHPSSGTRCGGALEAKEVILQRPDELSWKRENPWCLAVRTFGNSQGRVGPMDEN